MSQRLVKKVGIFCIKSVLQSKFKAFFFFKFTRCNHQVKGDIDMNCCGRKAGESCVLVCKVWKRCNCKFREMNLVLTLAQPHLHLQ